MTPPADLPVAAKLSPGFDRSTILRLLGTYGTIVVLVVMLVVFALAEPGTFATIGNFRNILNDMAIGTIVAGGLTVPLVAGDFDLSVGYVASFCGLLLVGLLSFNQLPIPVAMLIVIAIGAVIGIINGVIVSKLGVNAFIATNRPLHEHAAEPETAAEARIGEHVAELIEDGSTLQTGIGAVPDAILSRLGNKHVRSGDVAQWKREFTPELAYAFLASYRTSMHNFARMPVLELARFMVHRLQNFKPISGILRVVDVRKELAT